MSKQASFTGVIAVGMTFVMLTAGIDLSVGSNMYLSAMARRLLLQIPAMQNGAGAVVAVIVGLAAGALFGAIDAFCIVILRVTPFLVTLATLVAGRGLGTAVTEILRHRVPEGIHQPRHMAPARAGTEACPMARSRARQSASSPRLPLRPYRVPDRDRGRHIVLTRTAFGRQVYAVGNDIETDPQSRHRQPPHHLQCLRDQRCLLCPWRTNADRADRAADADLGVGKVRGDHAAVLGGASLVGGVGDAFGAVVDWCSCRWSRPGWSSSEFNLYPQPMVLAAIIFLAVFFDSLREQRMLRLKRRNIRVDEVARTRTNISDHAGNAAPGPVLHEQPFIIGVAMAIFPLSMIHASQTKATDPDRRRDPLAQAVLLAFSDPLAKEAEGRPG